MQTREEYEQLVGAPGKFEGEPIYVPYFQDVYLDGFGEPLTEGISSFEVREEDVEMFPELEGMSKVYLYWDVQGFVQEVSEEDVKFCLKTVGEEGSDG